MFGFMMLLLISVSSLQAAEIMGNVINRVTGKTATDIVMWVTQPSDSEREAQVTTFSVRQFDKEFEPRVTAVVKGSTGFFPNEDPFFHNIFSHNQSQNLDLGKYKGQSQPVVFEEPGIYPIGCEIHPWMSAFIIVVDALSVKHFEEVSRYKLENLQPGPAILHIWGPEFTGIKTYDLDLKDGMNIQIVDIDNTDLKRRRRRRRRRRPARGTGSYEP